jgi:deazaflavin-dependent oxidoreductase (nitroreductase family)
MTSTDPSGPPHYRAPGWLTRNVANRLVAALTRAGVSVMGSRVLETKGRTSGLPRRTPVNLLVLDGRRYLVAPRGEAQWVRNVRADGGHLALLIGRRREELLGAEVPVDQREAVLRAYLKRWKAEVGIFFDGVDATSSPAELARIAPRHPVFLLSAPEGA